MAAAFAVLRLARFGLQFLWLGRRTDRRSMGTAMGLSLRLLLESCDGAGVPSRKLE